MPDSEGKNLPPIPKEALDGESEKTELVFKKHKHNPKFVGNNTIQCSCGAGWTGSNIEALLQAFNA